MSITHTKRSRHNLLRRTGFVMRTAASAEQGRFLCSFLDTSTPTWMGGTRR
jgi:hypothetical protein